MTSSLFPLKGTAGERWPSLAEQSTCDWTMTPRLANLVLICDVSTTLNLAFLASRHPFLCFAPRNLAAAVARFDSPRITLLVFASGKVVVTGAKSTYGAELVMDRLVTVLRKYYPRAQLRDLRLQNFTLTLKLGWQIDLARCVEENPDICKHVQDSFPGMHIPSGVGRVQHIVFQSGEVVATGSRSEAHGVASLKARLPFYQAYAQLAPGCRPSNRKKSAGPAPATAKKRRGPPPERPPEPEFGDDADVLAAMQSVDLSKL